MKSNESTEGGMFTTLLQFAFIVLKLCSVIDWSWWWVLAPTWGTLALVCVVFLVRVAIEGIKYLWRKRYE